MKFTHRLDGFSSRFPPARVVSTAMPKPLRAHAAHVAALDGSSPCGGTQVAVAGGFQTCMFFFPDGDE